MNFTIFGAKGFIGSNLVSYLRSRGHSVLAPEREEILGLKVNLGHVVYAIGMTGNFRSKPFETVEAHTNILSQLLRAYNFDSWLYLSSSRLYGLSNRSCSEEDRINVFPGKDGVYDISKLLGEALCLSMQRPTVRVARLSNVYGVGQSKHTFLGDIFKNLYLHEDVEIRESPISSKDYIDISDVVKMIEQIALRGKYNIYNIASGYNTKHIDIASMIQNTLNVKASFKPNSKDRVFSKINIQRIKDDFSFEPQDIKHNFPKVLKKIINDPDWNCND